ncbi:hypothetical protein KIW84_012871 [Lathyrus oleraceus]|uniref:DUF7745 domain-containing protein n=1 Tax=Pisum sativum TaxID=3888 RepID=A0A9D5GX85_PEA|nr:hypothetical protein KIW84_012871 [Pisum sativum]
MILGVPLQHCVPFNSDIPLPEHKDIAKALHLEVFAVKENLSSKGGLSGFHLDFVIDKAEECAAQGNWEAVCALLGLSVYDNLELVKQVAGAWRNIQTKGATVYGKCNNISSSQYDSWLRERDQITLLPFSMGEPSDLVIVESVSMVEYNSLKQEKGKADKLNAKLSEGLRKTLCAKKEAEREVQRLNELQRQSNERIAEDADYIRKVCSGEDILKKACKAA